MPVAGSLFNWLELAEPARLHYAGFATVPYGHGKICGVWHYILLYFAALILVQEHVKLSCLAGTRFSFILIKGSNLSRPDTTLEYRLLPGSSNSSGTASLVPRDELEKCAISDLLEEVTFLPA